jgi:hypothetical protein
MTGSMQSDLEAPDPREQTRYSVTSNLPCFHLGIVAHAADRSWEALGVALAAALVPREAGARRGGRARAFGPYAYPMDQTSARDLLGRFPVIDGHNDLAWALRKADARDFDTTNLAEPVGFTHTDLPRLAQGGVGFDDPPG